MDRDHTFDWTTVPVRNWKGRTLGEQVEADWNAFWAADAERVMFAPRPDCVCGRGKVTTVHGCAACTTQAAQEFEGGAR